MNQTGIQDLLDDAATGLPITIEYHLISKDRIRFKVTHKNGCSVVLGSNRPCVFRYEHNIQQFSSLFRAAIGLCVWSPDAG